MITNSISETLHKKILNFNDACTFLDYSKSYLYKLTHSRQVPHYKPNGKKLYFKLAELEDWLLRNRVKTDVELQQQSEDYLNKKNRSI